MNRQRITWQDLVRIEPQLRCLEAEAWSLWAKAGDPYHAFYDRLKEPLSELVGWDRAPHPVLGSEEAYDVAYEYLFAVVTQHRPKRRGGPVRSAR